MPNKCYLILFNHKMEFKMGLFQKFVNQIKCQYPVHVKSLEQSLPDDQCSVNLSYHSCY